MPPRNSIESSHNNNGVAKSLHKSSVTNNNIEGQTSRAMNRITERLTKAVELATTPTETSKLNRSPELVPLTAEYEQFKKKMRSLIQVVKKYQLKTRELQETKFELVQQFAAMTEKTPIHDDIGCDIPDESTKQTVERLRQYSSSENPTTTAAVSRVTEEYNKRRNENETSLSLYGQYSFQAAQAVANDHEYQTHVVDYVVEWEQVITKLVDGELKHVKKLEGDRRHYERKLEVLRQRANDMDSKGKQLPQNQLEKLERNEDKLKETFTIHEREATKLCALIEAVTHDGYIDFYPFLKNYMKYEINRIGREHDTAIQMTTTLDSMATKLGNTRKSSKKGTKNKNNTNNNNNSNNKVKTKSLTT